MTSPTENPVTDSDNVAVIETGDVAVVAPLETELEDKVTVGELESTNDRFEIAPVDGLSAIDELKTPTMDKFAVDA